MQGIGKCLQGSRPSSQDPVPVADQDSEGSKTVRADDDEHGTKADRDWCAERSHRSSEEQIVCLHGLSRHPDFWHRSAEKLRRDFQFCGRVRAKNSSYFEATIEQKYF